MLKAPLAVRNVLLNNKDFMEANYYMVVIVAILLSTAIAYLLGNRFAKRALVELELAKQELEKINELLIAGQNAKALMQTDVQQAQLQLARTEADKQGRVGRKSAAI